MKTTDQETSNNLSRKDDIDHPRKDEIIKVYTETKSTRKVQKILNIPYKQVRKVLDESFDLSKKPAKWKTHQQEIVNLFNNGKTVTQISEELQIKRTDVGTCLENLNIRKKTKRNYDDMPNDIIIELYVNQKETVKQIAKSYNVSTKKITTILKKNNIKLRDSKIKFKHVDELINLRLNKRYSMNMLAKKYNCSRILIKRVFKENKVKYNQIRCTDYQRLLLHKDEIIKMYKDDKTSYEISTHFGVCFNLILKVLRENNVFVRPQGSGQNSRSIGEIEFFDFIVESTDSLVKNNVYDVIQGRELDIFIPDLKIAFEYNGLYWHSEINRTKNYHIGKTKQCYKNDIRLIHVFEDEWLNKKDIVKSRVLNILVQSNKIYARKCEIKEVNNTIKKQFLNDNHIQGTDKSNIKLGLYYNDELVSLMTFGKPRFNKKYEWELIRFCNKLNTTVVGGASKLFKYFIKTYNPKSIISYSDLRWGSGQLYENIGMNYINTTSPNYYYIIGKARDTRHNYTKDKLVKQGYDPKQTEHEIMFDRKIYRIYDCGNRVYTWSKS
jgi:AraC-like DNA-binding protein